MSADKKVKVRPLLTDQDLEATGTATQAYADREIIETYQSDQLNLSIKYTTGAGELVTNAFVKVYGYVKYDSNGASNVHDKPDADGWMQLGGYVLGVGGVATFVPLTFKVAGGAGGTEYSAHFAQGITFTKIMIEAYETGVVANKGKITVDALVQ